MADVELIDSYVDRQSVKGDTDFLIAQFEAALKKFDELNAKKLTLSGASSLKDVVSGTEAVNKQMTELMAQNAKLQKSYDDLAKKIAELGKSNANLSTTQEQQAKTVALVNEERVEAIKLAKEEIATTGQRADQNRVVADSYDAIVKQIVKNEHEINKLKTERQKLSEQLAEGTITESKYLEKLEEIKKEQSALSTTNQSLNRALKNYEKEAQAAAGSTNELRAQLNLALQAYDGLSAADKNGEIGVKLKATIDSLTAAVTESEQATGRFQRNVGNYPASAKIIVDALEKARLKYEELSKAANAAPSGPGGPGGPGIAPEAVEDARRQFESLRAVVDDKQFLKFAAGAGDAQKEVKSFTRVLIDMERRGEGNSQVAIDLRKHLAELTDQVGDARAEIKALASDTHSFDQFAGAVTFATDTVQTFVGAMSLNAGSEEDVQEATKTLIALQTVANGVKGIATELTTRGTAANKLFSFAQRNVALAMDETATAGVRLRAALVTIGIGALIIGIGLLIANFDKLKDAFSRLSETQKQMNKVNEDAIEGYVQEKTHIEVLVREVNNENTSKTRKKEIVKELNALSPTYFSNLKSEKDLQDKLTDSVARYVKAIELKARAKAAENLLVETEKPILERQIELQTDLESINNRTFDTEERKRKHIEGITKTIEESNKALATGIITPGVDKSIAFLIKQRAPLQKIVTDINQELDSIGGDPNKPLVLPFAATKKVYTDQLQSQADAFKKLSENEDAYLITRLSARQNSFDLQKKILNEQRAAELFNLDQQIAVEQAKGIIDDNKQKEFNQTRLSIINDSAEKQRALERQLGTDIISIRETNLVKQREQDQQYNEDFKKDQEDRLNAQIEVIQKEQLRRQTADAVGQQAEIKALNDRYEKQIAKAKEGSKKRQRIDEQYAIDRAEIEYQYAVAAVKNEIDAAEKILAVRKIAGIDVTEQEKQIHDLRLRLSDAETKHVIDNEKNKNKAFQERIAATEAALGKIQEIEGIASGIIGGLISANVDKQKNAVQEQIDDVDKKKEKEIAALDTVTLTEQQKAEKTAIINARADAQKQALERKQRQLDLQRARFDKAANITRIAIETNLAVVHQLGSGDPYTAIGRAVAAGIIGAAQLAAAIAQPLPKFKIGRKGGPATFGVVGDGGVQEVVSSPDLSQAFLTPATDTVAYLPKNWNVFPNVKEFQESAMDMVHKPLPVIPIMHNNNDGLIHAMAYSIGRLERAVMNKQETHFHWNNGELQKSIKNGNSWDRYIQGNI
jgi:hypothetical protein